MVKMIYSCLENPMGGGACQAAVHGVAESRIWLSDFTFTFHFHALEKEMATHSSVLAWRIPGMAEPSGLLSVGSHSWTWLKRLSSSSRNQAEQKTHSLGHAAEGGRGGLENPIHKSHFGIQIYLTLAFRDHWPGQGLGWMEIPQAGIYSIFGRRHSGPEGRGRWMAWRFTVMNFFPSFQKEVRSL